MGCVDTDTRLFLKMASLVFQGFDCSSLAFLSACAAVVKAGAKIGGLSQIPAL